MSILHAFFRGIDRLAPARRGAATVGSPRSDYFKPEHLQKFPELHDLVWKTLKAGSKARQEISLQAAEDLLKDANDIATIFWRTKGLDVITGQAASASCATRRMRIGIS